MGRVTVVEMSVASGPGIRRHPQERVIEHQLVERLHG